MDLQKYLDNQVKNKWFEWVKFTPDIPFCYYNEQFISGNPNLTIEIIRNNPDFLWNWDEICKNSAITMDDVENNPDFPWEYFCLSQNPNLTVEFVMKHCDKDWHWTSVYKNIGVSIDVVKNHPSMLWCFTALKQCAFTPDKQRYIAYHTKNANLVKMHNFFHENTDKVVKPIEYVIFDEYLLKSMLQY